MEPSLGSGTFYLSVPLCISSLRLRGHKDQRVVIYIYIYMEITIETYSYCKGLQDCLLFLSITLHTDTISAY
jgi:hypothetical protein